MSANFAVIIDDNPTNVIVLANLLNKYGVGSSSVMEPRKVEETLAEIDSLQVIFLDLEMPGRSGFDVLESLRADSRYRDIPVVAYTVHVSEFERAYQAGFHSFIPKPIDPTRFSDQLTRILHGEQVWERL